MDVEEYFDKLDAPMKEISMALRKIALAQPSLINKG